MLSKILESIFYKIELNLNITIYQLYRCWREQLQ